MQSKNHVLIPLAVMAIAVLSTLAGCGSRGGLLQRAGIADPSYVRMVVFQGAGYGYLPMNLTYPMRGKPAEVSHGPSIGAFYNAVNNPDGKHWTRDARNDRLAFISKDGRVIMFGFGGGGLPVKGQGPDITAKHSSSALDAALLDAAKNRKLETTTIPNERVKSLQVNAKRVGSTSPQFAKMEALWHELLDCYSPLSLKGNTRCGIREVQEQLQQSPQHIEVNMRRPAKFKAVVMPPYSPRTTWPPDYYDRSGAYEEIRYDRVYALAVPFPSGYFRNLNRLVRFAFVDSKTGDCLLTDPVEPRTRVKGPHGRQPAVYGPDLFAELIAGAESH